MKNFQHFNTHFPGGIMKYNILAFLAAAVLFFGCSSTKEEVNLQPPPVKKEVRPEKEPPPRVFTYTERYWVKNAVIGDPEKLQDPLQAIRVIQLQPGSGEVLVFSVVETKGETALETWFGIELPSFAPGTYDLSEARKISFYHFYLGDNRKRIDGQSCEGKLTIESNQDGELIGAISAMIDGASKRIGQESRPVAVAFNGSFRIKEVALENTIMKSR
jgi:hypothetical protein